MGDQFITPRYNTDTHACEYTNSYKIMNGLMDCVLKERDDQETEDKRTEMTNEVISLGEKILAGRTDKAECSTFWRK